MNLLEQIDAIGSRLHSEAYPQKNLDNTGILQQPPRCIPCEDETKRNALIATMRAQMAADVKCGIREDCLNNGQCIGCPFASPLPPPQIGLIIAARNEGRENRLARQAEAKPPFLEETIASARGQNKFLKNVCVVDDGSEKAEVLSGVQLLRNDEPMGCSGARHRGCVEGLDGCDSAAFLDPHMLIASRSFDRLARYAQIHRCFAYAGVTGHYSADLLRVKGFLKCKWTPGPQPKGFQRRTGMMGAAYVANVDQLKDMGGWIVLPVPVGSDEECMSVLCAKHRIPIFADCDVQNYHEFRRGSADKRSEVAHQQAAPFDILGRDFNLSIALFHRILFADATWNMFKQSLKAQGFNDTILSQAEEPEVLEYGSQLRERCAIGDAEFFFNFVPEGQP